MGHQESTATFLSTLDQCRAVNASIYKCSRQKLEPVSLPGKRGGRGKEGEWSVRRRERKGRKGKEGEGKDGHTQGILQSLKPVLPPVCQY